MRKYVLSLVLLAAAYAACGGVNVADMGQPEDGGARDMVTVGRPALSGGGFSCSATRR